MTTCPTDGSQGGTITFDFHPDSAGTIKFKYIEMLDIDENNPPVITIWKLSEDVTSYNTRVASNTLTATGDNGLYQHDFSTDDDWKNKYNNIKRIEIKFSGSGAISELRFSPGKCERDSILMIRGAVGRSSTSNNQSGGGVAPPRPTRPPRATRPPRQS